MKPNLGRYETPPDWEEILVHFRGSELQNYFTKILEDTLKATIKPQYVDHIPKAVKGKVGEILKAKDDVRDSDAFTLCDIPKRANSCLLSTYSGPKLKNGTYSIGLRLRQN